MFSKRAIIPTCIAIILFFVPFYWLGVGQIDLGGDSNRLYFYDPVSYLSSNTLYAVVASGFGLENINFLVLPFVGMLAVLRQFLSPTTVSSVFHGFSLSASFLFMYLVIRELIEEGEPSQKFISSAAIVGGLLYALSPALIGGWQYVLIIRNQIFLNPLMFYLLLKYFKSTNVLYMLVSLILSFIFSPNFSVIAAPPIVAFYPISVLFLMVYTVVILKKKIVWKHIGIGLVTIVLLQAFHLFPQLSGIFSKESTINASIFSSKGMYDRGLSYFLGIAPNIKASINLMGLPQMTDLGKLSGVFILFPLVILISFLYNKKKTLPLVTFFFLFVLFFSTANITGVGFNFYRKLFDIPGFSIFRNFYGQWQFAYIFYFSLLFGLSLSILVPMMKKMMVNTMLIFLVLILIVNAFPFLRGDILQKTLWQSKDVSPIITMDPLYEEALSTIRALPVEGKILTLPLTDPGYQVLAGKNGGAYMGPSTISYLSGKQDFSGYEEFWNYKNLVLDLFRTGQFDSLKRLLGLFNIKYIFYNADEGIYDIFPAFPYNHVRKFFPADQKKFREMVHALGLKEIKNIANKYYLYELSDASYIPQIYVAQELRYLRQNSFDMSIPLTWDIAKNGIGFYVPSDKVQEPEIAYDQKLVELQNSSTYPDFFKNLEDSRLPWGFVSHRLDSFLYPFILWRENRSLTKLRVVDDVYIERSLLLVSKRVNELLKFDKGIHLMGDVTSLIALSSTWRDPTILEALQNQKYNYWEISLVRYHQSMATLIAKISTPNSSQHSIVTNKALIERMLVLHKQRIVDAIRSNKDFKEEQQKYVAALIIEVFDALTSQLNVQSPAIDRSSYSFDGIQDGEYDVLIEKSALENSIGKNWNVAIGNTIIHAPSFDTEGEWFVYPRVSLSTKDAHVLDIVVPSPINIVQGNQWKLIEQNNSASASPSDTGEGVKLSFSNGLAWTIEHLNPRSYYVLSFTYNSSGKDFIVNWYEGEKENTKSQKIRLSKELLSHTLEKFTGVIYTGDYSNSGYIQITKDGANALIDSLEPELSKNEIMIKDLSLVQIPNPKVILRQSQSEYTFGENTAHVNFRRINPTKYIVTIKNITKPVVLVLAQKYSYKWKLIDINRNIQSVDAYIVRLMASIIRNVVNIFVKPAELNTQFVASYYEGKVNQYPTKSIFFDSHTLDTWGKESFDDSKHFEINGYANAWYIQPEDFDGKDERSFVIEMSSQQVFYASFATSFITVILCVYILIRILIQRSYD